MKKVLLYLTILCSNLFSSANLSDAEKRELGNQAVHQMMQKIWTEAMEVKAAYNEGAFNTKVLNDGWTAVTKDKSLSAQFEHTVGVTNNGYEIFTLSKKGLDLPKSLK